MVHKYIKKCVLALSMIGLMLPGYAMAGKGSCKPEMIKKVLKFITKSSKAEIFWSSLKIGTVLGKFFENENVTWLQFFAITTPLSYIGASLVNSAITGEALSPNFIGCAAILAMLGTKAYLSSQKNVAKDAKNKKTSSKEKSEKSKGTPEDIIELKILLKELIQELKKESNIDKSTEKELIQEVDDITEEDIYEPKSVIIESLDLEDTGSGPHESDDEYSDLY